ncbi:hypothetical protein PV327_011687 [Microctonus hyperodae]|uniref:Uncharacterized protein n=1 Tax=Microctonus hyperodae TaxID=165561 RepID=A0AA39C282_MICHY|nr:hypothetical protein PV327_011687 [Microctonus hyperodae]
MSDIVNSFELVLQLISTTKTIPNDMAELLKLIILQYCEHKKIMKQINAQLTIFEEFFRLNDMSDNEEMLIEIEDTYETCNNYLCELLDHTNPEIEELYNKLEAKYIKHNSENPQIDIQEVLQFHTFFQISNNVSKNRKSILNSCLTENNMPRKTIRIKRRIKDRKQKLPRQTKQTTSRALHNFVSQNQRNPSRKKRKYLKHLKNSKYKEKWTTIPTTDRTKKIKSILFKILTTSRLRKFLLLRH